MKFGGENNCQVKTAENITKTRVLEELCRKEYVWKDHPVNNES